MAELCRDFGISRKTGYKWLARYRGEGPAGLVDRSRAPHRTARAMPDAVAEAVIAARHRHPSWGPRKVKAWLEDRHPHQPWPAASSIGCLFDRVGLTRPRKRRRRTAPQSAPLAHAQAPNDVWCADFKGWFLTGDGTQVDPFTLSDATSRFLLRCQAVGRPDADHVWPILVSAFHQYGLPRVLRSDNGAPFASLAAGGVSRLAVKLIKAGVVPERIAPGKPQQNGRHERLHLTLKQDTASPPARSLAEQIKRFEAFTALYNEDRPHEALGQVPPARLYQPSPRRFDGRLRSPDYDAGVVIRQVRRNGCIKWQGREVFVTPVLAGEPVGLTEIDDDVWIVRYGPLVLGTMKRRQGLIRLGTGRPSRSKPDPGKPQQLSPMSPG